MKFVEKLEKVREYGKRGAVVWSTQFIEDVMNEKHPMDKWSQIQLASAIGNGKGQSL